MSGPLSGIRIVELAGIGPGPFACMMLADHGAEVIRIDRKGGGASSIRNPAADILGRSRLTLELDLKSEAGVAVARDLIASADGLVEGFRPGVTERLGLGPEAMLELNPRLVYGRMTGWGQTGPYSQAAGHDINYIALAGALHAFGRAGEKPTPPINMVGDFGGGGMMLAFGMVSALLHARTNGQGQVIDCAMTDGSALLMSMIWGWFNTGEWQDDRGTNLLDTGAHFYDTYRTSDGKFIALGSIEPQFYRELRERVGLTADQDFDAQMEPARWGPLRQKLETLFASATRDEWCARLEGSDACFAPVLSLTEAPSHPHNSERSTFLKIDDFIQPAPAPRYSVTATDRPRTARGETDVARVLGELGYSDDKISKLTKAGIAA